MASQLEAGRHFRYQNVQIFKSSKRLGAGSYGEVYRARCDELPCAAKVLHSILANPGAPRNQQRFEQECQFLSDIRHPHIVQYLGTCRDPDSGHPVLLMELMDDNLTHFLELSQQPLPNYLQLNLCHDIAMALAYLHSNGIIHRDLSSNNVLLIAGSRAKVTDFGMSKLLDAAPQMTPLTQCPGTAAYMPPEAMREPPVYTNKLDCFAHGIVAIQIMTRQFPDPSPALQLVDDPRSPTGKMLMPVLEPERRKSHIDCINPTHPLLQIAIQCLSYNEKDRPSAQQICHRIAELKEARQSMQRAQEDQCLGLKQANVIAKLQEKVHENVAEIQQLREEVRDKNDEIKRMERQLRANEQMFERTLVQKDKRIRDLEEAIFAREREEGPKVSKQRSEASNTAVDTIKLKWRQCPKAPCGMIRGSATVDGSMAYFRPDPHTVHAYDSDKEVWSQIPDCPHQFFTLAIVRGLLTAVGGKQSGKPTNTLLSLRGEGWSEHFRPMPTKRYRTAVVVCCGRSLVVAGGRGDSDIILSTVEVMSLDTEEPQWFTVSSLPCPMTTASATMCGENLYLLQRKDKQHENNKGTKPVIFTCSLSALLQSSQPQRREASSKMSLSQAQEHRVWQELTDIPVYRSTCITICGHLLAVGGYDTGGKTTHAIRKYDPVKNSWTVISHMTTARYDSLVAVLPGDKLMVVGGYKFGTDYKRSDVVEIATVS